MLTAIEIENFKAFGDRQRIELAPLTLLFGPNSGGKSSIIHALHYAREIMLGRGCDVHRTESGADFVDLGGFKNLIHRTDSDMQPDNQIRLTFELENQAHDDDGNGELGSWYNAYMDRTGPIGANNWEDVHEDVELEHLGVSEYGRWLFYNAKTLRITLTLDRKIRGDGSTEYEVTCYEVAYDGVPLAKRVRLGEWSCEMHLDSRLFSEHAIETRQGTDMVVLTSGWNKTVLPRWDDRVTHEELLEKLCPGDDEEEIEHYGPICLSHWITRLVAGPGEFVRDHLKRLRYVGPLRSIPPRVTPEPAPVGPSQWPSGLAAWECLEETPISYPGFETDLVQLVSEALSSSEMLDTGYSIGRVQKSEISLDVLRHLLAQVESDDGEDAPRRIIDEVREQFSDGNIYLRGPGGNSLEPHDVGVGISQVVPVVVACLKWDRESIVAIEQPELHLHPKQQAALGDILIRGTRAAYTGREKADFKEESGEDFSVSNLGRRNVIIETHSEHLILRILRRIRETTQQFAPPDCVFTPKDLSVLYVDPNSNTGASEVKRMLVDMQGQFVDPWPDSFFDQDSEERFN